MIKKRFLHDFLKLFAITTDVFNQNQSVFEMIIDRHFTPNSCPFMFYFLKILYFTCPGICRLKSV